MTERPKLTLERTFDASIDEVWELMTTPEGIESWWGPEGFSVTVREIDLRPGGNLLYAMSATGPEQREFMAKAGMPLTTEHRITFVVVDPPRRLVYQSAADFIPGIAPFSVETVIELTKVAGGVHMGLSFDRMHDDEWTEMARRGNESQLDRLAEILAKRE